MLRLFPFGYWSNSCSCAKSCGSRRPLEGQGNPTLFVSRQNTHSLFPKPNSRAQMIVGISYLASASKDDRGISVSSFNSASTSWQNSAFTTWQTYNQNFTIGRDAMTYMNLPGVTSADTYDDTDGITQPTRFLKFANKGTAFQVTTWSPTTPGAFALPGGLYVQRNKPASVLTSGQSVAISPLYTDETSFTCESSSSSSSGSDCNPPCKSYVSAGTGTKSRKCQRFFSVEKACFVVDPVSGNIESGCAVNTATKVPDSVTGKGSFGLSKFSFREIVVTSPPSSTQQFSSFDVTVRASTDPFVKALQLTNGSLNFGLTVAQKIAYGIGFLVAGGLLTFLVCGGIYCELCGCPPPPPPSPHTFAALTMPLPRTHNPPHSHSLCEKLPAPKAQLRRVLPTRCVC
jgi:hypothetical protein